MIGVGHTDVRVAKPLFHWELPDRTFLEPEEILAVHDRYTTQSGALLREAIEESERRRRASFRYCRYCRRLVAPEYLFAAATCQGCASRYHGALY